jgi:hypothetical protein
MWSAAYNCIRKFFEVFQKSALQCGLEWIRYGPTILFRAYRFSTDRAEKVKQNDREISAQHRLESEEIGNRAGKCGGNMDTPF